MPATAANLNRQVRSLRVSMASKGRVAARKGFSKKPTPDQVQELQLAALERMAKASEQMVDISRAQAGSTDLRISLILVNGRDPPQLAVRMPLLKRPSLRDVYTFMHEHAKRVISTTCNMKLSKFPALTNIMVHAEHGNRPYILPQDISAAPHNTRTAYSETIQ